MAKVVVYSSANCSYCVRAKQLLDSKGVVYEEIRVDVDDAARVKMMELSGRRTVPQIFINDKPVGGYDDIYALDKAGELDILLSASI
ncbi:MAG: glutaredoxin 3 [Pseudomonadota bacterium]|nr:glutaredoxin 3 [Pseudomonadota bacterium]